MACSVIYRILLPWRTWWLYTLTITFIMSQSQSVVLLPLEEDLTSNPTHTSWTTWSQCSPSCGSGLSRRNKHCLNSLYDRSDVSTDCDDIITQLRLCEAKSCPADQPSARMTSCSKYDSQVFSGRYYTWEPFIHPTDPCKLSCKTKESKFYANLAAKVEDGLPCKMKGAVQKAVCIEGSCQAVGCDDVVGSSARRDKCGRCQGDGTTCRTVSGIFTSTQLMRGLNHVISIPAGSMSINITELSPSRNLLVLQIMPGRIFINNGSRPTSGDVFAVGTIFSYVAKTAEHPRQTIVSPGPINSTVVLKLFSRGFNPGIMYSFSVPLSLGENFLHDITHGSLLTMRNPDKAQVIGNGDNNFDSTTISAQQVTRNEETHSTKKIVISDNPKYLPSEVKHSRESVDSTDSNSVIQTSDLFRKTSPGISAHNYAFERIMEASRKVQENRSRSLFERTIGSNNRGETKANHPNSVRSNGQTLNFTKPENKERLSESTTNSLNFDKTSQYLSSEETEDSYYFHTEEDNKTHDEHNNTGDLSLLENDKIKQILADHKVLFSSNEEENSHNVEKLISASQKQSVSIPLSSVIHPSAIERTKTGSRVSDNSGNSGQVSSKTVEKPGVKEISEETINHDKKINYVKDNTSEAPIDPVEEDVTVDVERDERYVHHHQRNANASKTKTHLFSNNPVTVPRNRTVFHIPKYSQSFTFTEKYKQVYGNSRKRRKLRRTRNRRRQHRSRIRSFGNGKRKVVNPSSINHNSQEPLSEKNRQEIRRRVKVRSQPRRDSTTMRGNLTSALEGYDPQVDVTYRPRYQREHHDDGSSNVQKTRRQRHMRDRQAKGERERQRQMREQRNEHNQRHRRYQDKLKRRREEEASRRTAHLSRKSRRRYILPSAPGQRSSKFGNNRNIENTRRRLSQPFRMSNAKRLGDLEHINNNDNRDVDRQTTHSTRPRVTTPAYTQLEVVNIPPIWKDRTGATGLVNGGVTEEKYVTVGSQGGSTGFIHSQRVLPSVKAPQRVDDVAKTSLTHDTFKDVYEVSSVDYTILQLPSRTETLYSSSRHVVLSHEIPINVGPSKKVLPISRESQSSIPSIGHIRKTRPDLVSALASNEVHVEEHLSFAESIDDRRTPVNSIRPDQIIPRLESTDYLPNQIHSKTLASQHAERSTDYEWRISGLTECSQSCGGGAQQTIVVCVDTVTQATVTNENCLHIDKPETLTVKCNTRPCPAVWSPGPWSSCTVTCGEGTQTRHVICQTRVSPTLNVTMPAARCEDQGTLQDTQTCTRNACSSWTVTQWSQCSTGCGDGLKTRDVHCEDLLGEPVQDDQCTALKPDTDDNCNLGTCGKGWFFTDWPESCPAKCGTGKKTRQMFCSGDKGDILPNSRCTSSNQPSTQQTCKADRPCGGEWFVGDWSKCTVECGNGTRSRDILCVKSLHGDVFAVVGEENCDSVAKPMDEEPCVLKECRPEWYMTSWNECSQSCDTGYRTREVRCLSGHQQPSHSCPIKKRPRTREPCNTNHCDQSIDTPGKDPDCYDKFSQCNVVKRTRRLCKYKYYQNACCESCSGETRN